MRNTKSMEIDISEHQRQQEILQSGHRKLPWFCCHRKFRIVTYVEQCKATNVVSLEPNLAISQTWSWHEKSAWRPPAHNRAPNPTGSGLWLKSWIIIFSDPPPPTPQQQRLLVFGTRSARWGRKDTRWWDQCSEYLGSVTKAVRDNSKSNVTDQTMMW